MKENLEKVKLLARDLRNGEVPMKLGMKGVIMDLQLSGKLALVTGSTAGIGLAIGSTLAGEGATVILNGRSKKRVTDAVEKIRQEHPHAKLESFVGDLSSVEAFKQVTSSF